MYAQEISSIKDERIVLCRALTTGAGRAAHKKFLLYGQEQIDWAMQAGVIIEFILCAENNIASCADKNITCYYASEGILKKATETSYVIPLVAVAQYPAYEVIAKHDFILVLDHVLDPGNIGTIVRSAQGFGVKDFMITSMAADSYQRKIIDASRGTVFSSRITNVQNPVDAINLLKKQGYQIVVTTPHAQQLQSQVSLQKRPIALVVGNETMGASQSFLEQADVAIQIPMLSVESLNVGVAAGISLYELQFRLVLLMLREKIVANLGRQINVTGELIQKAFDQKIYAVTGLSGMHVILLMIILCDKKMTRADISKDIALFDQDLDDFLSSLLERELIATQDALYYITHKGEIFLAQVWPVVQQAQEMILEGFTAQEREQLDQFLGRLQHNCESILQSE